MIAAEGVQLTTNATDGDVIAGQVVKFTCTLTFRSSYFGNLVLNGSLHTKSYQAQRTSNGAEIVELVQVKSSDELIPTVSQYFQQMSTLKVPMLWNCVARNT